MAEQSEIQFNYEAWDKLLSGVRAKWKKVENRKEFGGIIAATVFQNIMKHFEEEMGPDGPWEKWSKSYMQSIAGLVAFRRVQGRTIAITDDKFLSKNKPPRKPGKKLQASGRLRNSFKPRSWRAENVGIVFFNKAQTKDGFPYAAHHDKGPSAANGKPRTFMFLDKEGMENLADRVAKWLMEGIK